ncbi:DUF1648 domain-containing protein [Rossellomorea vietnamensis]|uniref:DUF1648 domain-containing protein n=1 Tax=Rossellomorea vietnamensis TaxID=218284 RepID=UPI003CF4A465
MLSPSKRPKIKIPKTKSEWMWDIAGYAMYIGSIIFLLFHWSDIPDKVPAHYNALGEIDRWGSKTELFILPAVGVFLLIFMQLFEKFPESHNYPQRFNEHNAKQFYLLSRKMMNRLKNICLIIFASILYESVSIALGWGEGLGVWFLPVTLLGAVYPIVSYLIQQRKIQ